jgi:hypothetical protein
MHHGVRKGHHILLDKKFTTTTRRDIVPVSSTGVIQTIKRYCHIAFQRHKIDRRIGICPFKNAVIAAVDVCRLQNFFTAAQEKTSLLLVQIRKVPFS